MVIGRLAIFSLAGGPLLTADPCEGVTQVDSPELFNQDGSCDESAWDDYAKDKFAHARTVAFSAFIMFQLFNVMNCRSIDKSAFKLGLFKNIFISASFFISLFLLIIIVQNSYAVVPLIGITVGSFLSTIPLELTDWAMIFIFASSVFWIEEFRKFMFKSRRQDQ